MTKWIQDKHGINWAMAEGQEPISQKRYGDCPKCKFGDMYRLRNYYTCIDCGYEMEQKKG